MGDKMSNIILSCEIKRNIHEIVVRIKILLILFARALGFTKRIPKESYDEYDAYWNNFWEKKDIFREDLVLVYNGKPLKNMTPYDYKKETILKLLSDLIEQYDIKNVLEIGSGAGLNLVYLASKYQEVNFTGIEPTSSGVNVLNDFIANPPIELVYNGNTEKINNLSVLKASIIEEKTLEELSGKKFDLVFSCAVLEQLQNNIDLAFDNIFKIDSEYYLFFEEWLDGNTNVDNYRTLVDSDYFRLPWSYLNNYNGVEVIEAICPLLQPSWLNYSGLLLKRTVVEDQII